MATPSVSSSNQSQVGAGDESFVMERPGCSPEGLLLGFPVVAGGPLPSGHEYELHEVRFHWGKENQRGSEHTVNFKAFPMEVGSLSHTLNSVFKD